VFFYDGSDYSLGEMLSADEAAREDYIQFDKGGLLRATDESSILMQYTGVKDKHGCEVYEGDIVKDFYAGVVRFGEHEAEIFSPVGWYVDVPGFFHNEPLVAESGEVIGNIYENPNILPMD
jgi:uncharacterized phage protein (TIGR01671 family)